MDIIKIAKECDAFKHEHRLGVICFYGEDFLKFAQRIEQPHLQRIAELEQQIKQLREALLNVRRSIYLNYYGEWAMLEGFNGFDIILVDKALEQTK